MRALLDSHILIWMLTDAKQLNKSARRLIDSADSLSFSVVSLWELQMKQGLGKLSVDIQAMNSELRLAGVECLNLEPEHIHFLSKLPDIHRDPFDRILIAQAIADGFTLITSDELLAEYGKNVLVL